MPLCVQPIGMDWYMYRSLCAHGLLQRMVLTGLYIWHVCWTARWFFEGGFSVKFEVFLMNFFLAKIIRTLLRHALLRTVLAHQANRMGATCLRCNF